jgi:hypothetical protein
MYDYIIYGGGPTGITLGLLLSKNYKVAIIEKKETIGGTWRVEWKGGLFTEHSPKVTVNDSENFVKLMEEIGLNFDEETEPVYPAREKLGIMDFLIKNMSILDIIKLILVYIYYILTDIAPYKTVKEWSSNFSETGKKGLGTLSILVSDIPEKVMMEDLLDSFQFYKLLKLKDPEKWVKYAKKELEKRGVDIYYNLPLTSLSIRKGGIVNNLDRGRLSIKGHKHILTLPPLALYEVLSRSGEEIRGNWGNQEKVFDLLLNSYYSSMGFQLHYNKKIKVPENFCWHCETGGIALSYNTPFGSSHVREGTIITGTIVDQRNIKNIDDSIKSVIKNIVNIIGHPPSNITINKVKRSQYIGDQSIDNQKFNSEDTAFVRTKRGILKPKGKLSELYTVGSHNSKGVSTINKSINNAKVFFYDIMENITE